MYDIFDELCKKNGVTPYKVCKELGISQGTISNWKNRGNNLSAPVMRKIADYFDVSVDYLMGSEKLEWNAKTQEVVKVENPYNKIPNDAMFVDEKMNLLIDGMNNDEKFAEAVMDYVLKLTAEKIKKIQEKE